MGRDLVRGLPAVVEVSDKEIYEALREPVRQIIETVIHTLEHSPPELAEDIVAGGITMAGGGALLRNFDKAIAVATGLPVVLADDPLTAVVVGSGLILDRFEEFRDVVSQ